MIPRHRPGRPLPTLVWAMGYAAQARTLESYVARYLKVAETPPRERDQQTARTGAFEAWDASRIAWINAIRSLIS